MKTIDEQIAAAKRELAMRKRVYPRRVQEGKMPQESADHETQCMEAIIGSLQQLQAKQGESLL